MLPRFFVGCLGVLLFSYLAIDAQEKAKEQEKIDLKEPKSTSEDLKGKSLQEC